MKHRSLPAVLRTAASGTSVRCPGQQRASPVASSDEGDWVLRLRADCFEASTAQEATHLPEEQRQGPPCLRGAQNARGTCASALCCRDFQAVSLPLPCTPGALWTATPVPRQP